MGWRKKAAKWISKKIGGKTDDVTTIRKLYIDPSDITHLNGVALVPVSEIGKVAKAANRADEIKKGIGIMKTAQNLNLTGIFKGSLALSIVTIFGYGTWKATSLVGVISEGAEDTINNFFGITCGEGDAECQEKGAKNMLVSGLLVTAVIGGLVVLSLKEDSQEPVKEDSQEPVASS